MDTSVKNLIFDLGGVILDLSIDTTLRSFATLSGLEEARVRELYTAPGFEAYEKGLISDEEFRSFVRDTYKLNVSDDDLDATWNAMLLGIPRKKLDLLLRLKEQYNVFLLSNTNSIHIHHISTKMLPALTGAQSLDPYFHKAYYSHVMKMRKPDAEIFEQVLKENGLKPEQTLFLDDNADNITGANAVGIKTVRVTPNTDMILDYFHA